MIASVSGIEIFSDIVYAWCFIGKRRLDPAILEVRCDGPRGQSFFPYQS